MNKTTLLTAGIIAGVVIAFSYRFLGDDVESAKNQQRVAADAVQVKAPPISSSNKIKAVTVSNENNSEQQTPLVDESSYVRAAPPPPMSANSSIDGRHTPPHVHGHEEISDSQKINAAPPPTGAN